MLGRLSGATSGLQASVLSQVPKARDLGHPDSYVGRWATRPSTNDAALYSGELDPRSDCCRTA